MTGIIDYGMGNLLSVFHAVEATGNDALICRTPESLQACDRLILPGVGAFGDCIANLQRTGMAESLQELVIRRARPILGICLGMQAMAQRGFEGAECFGLGWFSAEVVRMTPSDPKLRVPQVGWNNVDQVANHPIWRNIPNGADFYFVHSFSMRCQDPSHVLGTCEHGNAVIAAVGLRNIVATQFHPEKSQEHGLRLIANFHSWAP